MTTSYNTLEEAKFAAATRSMTPSALQTSRAFAVVSGEDTNHYEVIDEYELTDSHHLLYLYREGKLYA